MRYLWRLGGDSRRVTPAAANAAVSQASRATAATPTSGRPRPAMTTPGDAQVAKLRAAAGQPPIGRFPAPAVHDLRAVRSRATAAWPACPSCSHHTGSTRCASRCAALGMADRALDEGGRVTAAYLLVLAPWLIFGAALAAICYHLLSRRGGR